MLHFLVYIRFDLFEPPIIFHASESLLTRIFYWDNIFAPLPWPISSLLTRLHYWHTLLTHATDILYWHTLLTHLRKVLDIIVVLLLISQLCLALSRHLAMSFVAAICVTNLNLPLCWKFLRNRLITKYGVYSMHFLFPRVLKYMLNTLLS